MTLDWNGLKALRQARFTMLTCGFVAPALYGGAIILTGLVALSRIALDAHTPVETLVGGTIGALPRSVQDDAFANVCPTRL